jgi:hypothetical protein
MSYSDQLILLSIASIKSSLSSDSRHPAQTIRHLQVSCHRAVSLLSLVCKGMGIVFRCNALHEGGARRPSDLVMDMVESFYLQHESNRHNDREAEKSARLARSVG